MNFSRSIVLAIALAPGLVAGKSAALKSVRHTTKEDVPPSTRALGGDDLKDLSRELIEARFKLGFEAWNAGYDSEEDISESTCEYLAEHVTDFYSSKGNAFTLLYTAEDRGDLEEYWFIVCLAINSVSIAVNDELFPVGIRLGKLDILRDEINEYHEQIGKELAYNQFTYNAELDIEICNSGDSGYYSGSCGSPTIQFDIPLRDTNVFEVDDKKDDKDDKKKRRRRLADDDNFKLIHSHTSLNIIGENGFFDLDDIMDILGTEASTMDAASIKNGVQAALDGKLEEHSASEEMKTAMHEMFKGLLPDAE